MNIINHEPNEPSRTEDLNFDFLVNFNDFLKVEIIRMVGLYMKLLVREVSVVSGKNIFYLYFPNGLQFSRRRLENPENLSWSHWRTIMRIERTIL